MTVAENVVLDSPRPLRPPLGQVAKRISQLADRLGFEIDPHAKVSTLPVGVRQRVEIIKALYRQVKVLILDEPTAVLTPKETDDLLAMLKKLAADGMSILFISHKFNEVMAVSDVITVMRRGKNVGTLTKEEFDHQLLARKMTGRSIVFHARRENYAGEAKQLLRVEHLYAKARNDKQSVKDMTFSVNAGEVLAIAGVDGNGQQELLQALAGTKRIDSGSIFIKETNVTGMSPKKILDHKVGYIPSDRHEEGLILAMNLEENLMLECYAGEPWSKRGVLNPKQIEAFGNEAIARFDIRAESSKQAAASLSGGNQQKVVVARAMVKEPEVLLAAYPTRGLDVGAIESIHGMINKQREKGCAVVLFSNELDEVFSLGDRIGVLFEGRMMGIYPASELSMEKVGLMMAGQSIQAE